MLFLISIQIKLLLSGLIIFLFLMISPWPAIEKKYSSFNFALKWSKLKYIENVVMKGSAPSILDNSRICLGWAWTYLIVAEIVGAEHGIGYAKAPFLDLALTEPTIALMRTIKHALDPNDILNPGKMLTPAFAAHEMDFLTSDFPCC